MRRIRRLLSLLLLLSGVVGADIGFITYLGGSGTDRAFTVTTDAAGNVYTVGVTDSRDFPVRNALQSTFGGGASDGFVAKLSPAGQVLWATYLGGTAQDEATRVEVDQAGNVFVVGTTRSADFLTTPNAYQTTLKGTSDAFVVKLSPNGDKVIYSTLLGGTGDETAPGMLLDAAGFVAVAGSTGATDLIATDDAAFKTNQGGTDAYIAVLDPAGERLVYLTYFGGSGNDTLTGIALGHGGNLYFTGQTTSTNLPVSDPAYQRTLRGNGDAYLARLSPDKQRAEYVTYLGGSASDTGADVRVDFSENVFVSGNTSSTDFPVFPAGSTRYEGGPSDVFLAQFSFPRGNRPGARLANAETGSGRALGLLVAPPSSKRELGGELPVGSNEQVATAGVSYRGGTSTDRMSLDDHLSPVLTFNFSGPSDHTLVGVPPCPETAGVVLAGYEAFAIGSEAQDGTICCVGRDLTLADHAWNQVFQVGAGWTPTNIRLGTPLTTGVDAIVFSDQIAVPGANAYQTTVSQLLPDQLNASDPVATSSGELYEHELDFALGGPLPLSFIRYYASNLAAARYANSALGPNWMHNFDIRILFNQARTQAFVQLFRSKVVIFNLVNNVWRPATPEAVTYQLAAEGQLFRFFDPAERLIYTFNANQRLARIDDLRGNGLVITPGANGPTQVTDGLGRTLTFTYTGTQLTRVTDQGARNLDFTYSGTNLASVTRPDGKRSTYEYTTTGAKTTLLTRRTLPEGNIPLTQEYDSTGRVVRQSDSRGNSIAFAYNTPTPRTTTITDPTGAVTKHRATSNHMASEATDPEGNVTAFEHDSDGRRTGRRDRIGGVTGKVFDTAGNLVSQAAADSATARHAFSALRFNVFTFYRPASTTLPDGSTLRYSYDSRGNLTSLVDRAGQTWTFTYNERGWPIGLRTPRGATAAAEYNADGTPSSVRLPTGETIRIEYDNLKRPTRVTRGDGTSRNFAYDSRDRVTSVTDERGKATAFTYDGNGRRISRTDRLSQTARAAFDGDNRIVTRTNPLDQVWRWAYDPVGRLASVTDPTGVSLTRTYDRLGYITAIADPGGVIARFTYNAEGVPTSVANAEGQTWRFTSDLRRRVTEIADPAGSVSRRTYDNMNRLASVTNALGDTRRRSYDAAGRLQRLTDAEGNSTTLGYDADSRLERITDPRGNQWTVTRDEAGRAIAQTDPTGLAYRYEYNARGRLAKVTRPDDTTAEFTYDEAGRLIREAYSDGTEVRYERDDRGRVVKANGLTLTYDAAGRIVESNGIRNEYDAAGRIIAIHYAPDRAVRYEYNNRGLMTRMTDWTGRGWDFDYDNARRLTAIRRPNGTTSSYTYGSDGRRNSIRHAGEKFEASENIQRDAAGRVTSLVRNIPSIPEPPSSESQPPESSAGNKFAIPDFPAGVQELPRSPNGRLEGYEYDPRGNLLVSGDRRFSWNARNQLTRLTTPSQDVPFEFDAFGRVTRIGDAAYIWNYATSPPMLTAIRRDAGSPAAAANGSGRRTASSSREETFVLPHVLEVTGRIQGTAFTFHTTFYVTYTGGGGDSPESAPVEIYTLDEPVGPPAWLGKVPGLALLFGSSDGDVTGSVSSTPDNAVIATEGVVPGPLVTNNTITPPDLGISVDRSRIFDSSTGSPANVLAEFHMIELERVTTANDGCSCPECCLREAEEFGDALLDMLSNQAEGAGRTPRTDEPHAGSMIALAEAGCYYDGCECDLCVIPFGPPDGPVDLNGDGLIESSADGLEDESWASLYGPYLPASSFNDVNPYLQDDWQVPLNLNLLAPNAVPGPKPQGGVATSTFAQPATCDCVDDWCDVCASDTDDPGGQETPAEFPFGMGPAVQYESTCWGGHVPADEAFRFQSLRPTGGFGSTVVVQALAVVLLDVVRRRWRRRKERR